MDALTTGQKGADIAQACHRVVASNPDDVVTCGFESKSLGEYEAVLYC